MNMIPEVEEKLKGKLKKLSRFIVKNNISKSDILDMCLNDDNAQVYCDIIGKTLDYF